MATFLTRWTNKGKTQENEELKRQLEEQAEKNKFPPFNWPDLWEDEEKSNIMTYIPIINLIVEVALLIILLKK